MAIYDPFDIARGTNGNAEDWRQRTGLPADRLQVAWQELMRRGLITPAGIPHSLLKLESLKRAHPYCEHLRSLQEPTLDQSELELGDGH